MSGQPVLVVVTGPPASGKTSAAETLAERLQLAVLSKDVFKETLYEEFGAGEDLEERIERAALALLFAVAGIQLDAGVSLLLESNFDTRLDVAHFRRLSDQHGVRLVQVHIGGDTERLVEKFARRAASSDRHPGHGDEPADADELRAKIDAGLWEPLDLPGDLIEADMDDSEEQIVERVQELLGADPRPR
jgi:predicted kinase